MKRITIPALVVLSCLVSTARMQAQFISFDAPDASPGQGGTSGVAVAQGGAITGWYYDMYSVQHGFLRTPDGAFSEFDPPASIATYPNGMNTALTITGYYSGTDAQHSFLRSSDNTIITHSMLPAPKARSR